MFDDFKELLSTFNAQKVRYLLVGGGRRRQTNSIATRRPTKAAARCKLDSVMSRLSLSGPEIKRMCYKRSNGQGYQRLYESRRHEGQ